MARRLIATAILFALVLAGGCSFFTGPIGQTNWVGTRGEQEQSTWNDMVFGRRWQPLKTGGASFFTPEETKSPEPATGK